MGTERMEIASVMKLVLFNTTPAVTNGKRVGQNIYWVKRFVEAEQRIHALLDQHVLYPELDVIF